MQLKAGRTNKIKPYNVVFQENSCIIWNIGEKQEKFSGEITEKQVVKDYGLIIRMENPFSSVKKKPSIVLLSGSHTYGTIAATKYFTEYLVKEYRFLRNTMNNLYIIVECDVFNGYPVAIKEIKRYESN